MCVYCNPDKCDVFIYIQWITGEFFQSRLTENCSNHRHRLNQPCFTAKTYPEAMDEALEAENKLNSTELTTFREKTKLLIFLWLAKKQSKTESNGFMRLRKGLRKLFINTITFSKIMNRLWPFLSMLLKTFDVWPPCANNKGGLSLTLLAAHSLFSQLLTHIAHNTGKHLWKSQGSIRLLYC